MPEPKPSIIQKRIKVERERQIELGYTAEHDDTTGREHLIVLAKVYARNGLSLEACALLAALDDYDTRNPPLPPLVDDQDKLADQVSRIILDGKNSGADQIHLNEEQFAHILSLIQHNVLVAAAESIREHPQDETRAFWSEELIKAATNRLQEFEK
jgi:hypothetical protein